MALKGSALEAIERINRPFALRWHPGNPGRIEWFQACDIVEAQRNLPVEVGGAS